MNLNVKKVSKTYHFKEAEVRANQDISFHAKERDMIWLSGASGSGKTTLMNILTGIDSADSGEVFFDETPLLSLNDKERTKYRANHLGLIFQHFELVKYLNVEENLQFMLKLNGLKDPCDYERMNALVESFEISSILKHRTQNISGGQKQRVSIVRSLSHSPRFIIGDEITSSLDSNMSHKVYRELKKYSTENEAIVICISHDPIIQEYANRHLFMEDGNLTEKSL